MNLRLLAILAIIFLSGTTSRAFAANDPSAPVTDPATVKAHYREVLQRPEFQETEETDVNAHLKEVLSQCFLRLGEKFGEFKYASEMSRFASMLLTLLALLAVTGLLYVGLRLFRRRHDLDEPGQKNLPEQKLFHSPEFYEKEIQEAIQAADWHAAWLATWRQFLSRLEKRQLVEADRTRTNREYLEQLRAQTLPATALALLTTMVDAYDKFIYGRKSIGEPDWTLFYQQANETALLLHLEEKGIGARPKPGAA